MSGHIRTGSTITGPHDVGDRRCITAAVGSRFLAWAATILFAMAPLVAGPAQAAEQFIDFEQFTGPNRLSAINPPLTLGEATISGGQIVTNVRRLRRVNRSTVYGSAHFCSGCGSTITIEFSKPVSDVSFMLMNGRSARPWFEVQDDAGNKVEFRLGMYFLAGSSRLVTLPSSGIRKITIGQVEGVGAILWQFYIDNLRYTVDEGRQYLVNFSAFVPHDNMPAGPTAFCLSKKKLSGGNWRPPGLRRQDRLPSGNARWARDDGFTPDNGANADTELKGNHRKLYFAGDNRGFHPAAPTYRLRQLVTAIPDETVDADGVKDSSVRNLAGEVRGFAEDAMTDGVIDDADEDGIADDCSLFHRAHLAETDLMDVTVTRTGPKSLQIRFSGALDSPLVGPGQVLGAIDWDFTLTLDDSVEPGVWTLSGAHDGFPAYEIYINGTPVYQHDPGAPPYEFAKDVRKLLPPLDVEMTEISGELP